ncbi:hypothetical protein B0H14DRAFT_2736966 [Mycena olivaceomarginata]|nr:hypothetical protein B0H14DRAFT_2736966 [Mycena olivaceomarginata]
MALKSLLAMSNETLLPDGSEWLIRMDYTTREVHGVTVLIVLSCVSLTAVVGLLLAISLSAFNTRSWSTDKYPHLFVRTHQTGSILNARWIRDMAVEVGDVCTLQDCGLLLPPFWTLVIAIHTFCLLVLQLKPSWSGICAIVIAGPTIQNTPRYGPFYGISGYWLDYLFENNDNHALIIAKTNALCVAYTIIILLSLPSRFSSFAGLDVPFEVTIFTAAVFLLSGVVNVTSNGTYPESYGAKEKSYSSNTDSMRTTDSAVPTMLAPPPRSHCGSGEGVYSLYEADSVIPLSPPADVAYHVGYGR